MIAIHNSRSAEYRKPFGAVKLGGTVFLALDIFEADDVSAVCRLWVDKKGEQLIEMKPEIKDGFVRFSCSFTPEEAQLARDCGFAVCAMGPRILRCETAPLIPLTAVLYETGNLD